MAEEGKDAQAEERPKAGADARPTDETADVPPHEPSTDETIEDAVSARALARRSPGEGGRAASGAVRDTFARYEIRNELGRGGMGIVYRARDPKLKRVVALKVLIAGEDATQEQVVRFFREAESAARLRHPNIVPIHELDVHEGKHYFTMDYVEGTPLDEVIALGRLDALAGQPSPRIMEAGQHGSE